MSGIKFGTDGWRDIIADNFTFANVRVVVQGIASYINSHQLAKRGLVIGYDNRFLSRDFAKAACSVLAGNGIRVYMPEKSLPTPVTAYAVRLHKAGGAIMITASHNPPPYNGLKFIPEYAGPALPEITDEIEKEIRRVIEGGRIYELSPAEADELGLIARLDVDESYINHLQKLVNLKVTGEEPPTVVVDPMFGAGIGYLEKVLQDAGYKVVPINNHRDPLFGGSMPEPTDQLLGDLKEAVVSHKAILGLALDGDADRFGVVDDQGRYWPPNRILYLLLQHILRTRSIRGPVARTLATTHMLDRVAEANGLAVLETPVGFKYIGQCLREKGCIMGGEESGGMSILGHVPEKDGILAGLLVAEMLAVSGKTLSDIHREFVDEYGSMDSERLDVKYKEKDREQVLANLKEYRPRQIAGKAVESISEREGKKIILEDDSWVLIRSSGTEPVFRIYVEAPDLPQLKAIQTEVRGALGI
ncbi:MAG: phosphoglucomutase/phosphomannomutase family protein [Bacillota bacterium]